MAGLERNILKNVMIAYAITNGEIIPHIRNRLVQRVRMKSPSFDYGVICKKGSHSKMDNGRESIYNKYELLRLYSVLEKIENEVGDAINAQKNPKGNVDYRNVLSYSLGKSLVDMREIIILCAEGMPDGALSIARNIFEQFVIVEYLNSRLDKDSFDLLLEKYQDDYVVKRAKALIFYETEIGNSNERKVNHENELKKIKMRYNIKSLNQYWWSGCNTFSELCNVVSKEIDCSVKNFFRFMEFIYRRASLSIHSSYMGNIMRLGSDSFNIEMGPWITGQEVPLFLGTASLILIAGYTYNYLELNYTSVKEELNDLCTIYKEMINRKM